MNDHGLIKTLHSEFQDRLRNLTLANKLIARAAILPDDPDKVTVAIGMRRVGKTILLLQEIIKLQTAGIPITQILYIDFEDDRLQPLTQEKLANLLDSFYTLYPENHNQRCYLFLDEIQNIPDWPLVIRRYMNTKNAKIYLTGSSAKLLSKEIATSMRGRAYSVELWPFSFYEYLSCKNIHNPEKILSKASHDQYSKLLTDYLSSGGFPEVVNQSQLRWINILQDYTAVVTYRDIIERYNISNITVVKRLIAHLLKNAATSFSVNKFFNDLKSQGYSIGRATLYDYINYIEDAYIAFSVPLYSESIRKTQHNPKKIYSIDPGLTQANELSLSPNYGRLFENLVYLDLRRRGDEVYYYLTKERYEVDFLTRSRDNQLHLYQVAWDISDTATHNRELRALHAAEQELGITGELITAKNYFEWNKLY